MSNYDITLTASSLAVAKSIHYVAAPVSCNNYSSLVLQICGWPWMLLTSLRTRVHLELYDLAIRVFSCGVVLLQSRLTPRLNDNLHSRYTAHHKSR